MNNFLLKKTSYVVIFAFFFLLIGDAYPLRALTESDALALIEKGEAEYSEGSYLQALASFNRALQSVKGKKNRARLVLDIALAQFALGESEKCSETLSMYFDENPEKRIDREEYPKGFVQIYDQTQFQAREKKAEQERLEGQKIAEALKESEEKSKLEKEKSEPEKTVTPPPQVQETEKLLLQEKKKKKFPLLPVLLGAGAVVVLLAVLLGKKSSSDTSSNGSTGSIQVSSVPIGAQIYLDDSNTGKTTNTTLTNVSPGSHSVKLILSGFMEFSVSVSVAQGQTATVSGTLEIEMVTLPSSAFYMGSNSGEAYLEEKPVHWVNLSSFQIGKYEVTQALWKTVMGSNPSYHIGDSYPVEGVSWNEAQTFIQKLNTMTGKQYRLPTEAEWEYACRALNTSDRYGDLNSIAWYASNSGGSTHAVGTKQPSGWGLYDMLGNVLEWCQDWFGYYPSEPQTNPTGPGSGSRRILRGGAYNGPPVSVRASSRHDNTPSSYTSETGLRLAKNP
jgi:formylglycine-generating enzyme required for sulfatase activity